MPADYAFIQRPCSRKAVEKYVNAPFYKTPTSNANQIASHFPKQTYTNQTATKEKLISFFLSSHTDAVASYTTYLND